VADVGIGFREHSGWAAAVTVSGRPAVLDRRRMLLCDPGLPRQPYHAAVGLDLDRARDLVVDVERSAAATAGHELACLVGELNAAGHRIRGVAVAVGTAKVPEELATVLGSHALLHAAEGELYREALADAVEAAGLPVVRFVAREVLADAAAALRRPIADMLAELGAGLGPPWAKDQKEAAAAALLALHTAA
jgi:hypothetical protein